MVKKMELTDKELDFVIKKLKEAEFSLKEIRKVIQPTIYIKKGDPNSKKTFKEMEESWKNAT